VGDLYPRALGAFERGQELLRLLLEVVELLAFGLAEEEETSAFLDCAMMGDIVLLGLHDDGLGAFGHRALGALERGQELLLLLLEVVELLALGLTGQARGGSPFLQKSPGIHASPHLCRSPGSRASPSRRRSPGQRIMRGRRTTRWRTSEGLVGQCKLARRSTMAFDVGREVWGMATVGLGVRGGKYARTPALCEV